MSDDPKAGIRTELSDAQQQLLAVLNRVGPDDWHRTSPHNEGWTIHQLLTHLTTAEVAFLPALRRISAGEGGVPADFDANRWNASQLRRRGEVPVVQLRTELEAAHRDMLALLDGLDARALDHRGHLSTGDEGSAADNFRLVALHKRSHVSDIGAALGATSGSER